MRFCNCTLPYADPNACTYCPNKTSYEECKFINDFVNEQVPLPPEFQKVLDDNYWELIGD